MVTRRDATSREVAYIDPLNPGIVRFHGGDAFDGVIAGTRAQMIVDAVNAFARSEMVLKPEDITTIPYKDIEPGHSTKPIVLAPSATPCSGWEAHEDIPNIKAEYVHHVNLDRPLVTRTADGKWWVHPAIGVPK